MDIDKTIFYILSKNCQTVLTYFALALLDKTLDILMVPSKDFVKRTGDLDLSSLCGVADELANAIASGGTSPSGNSNEVSSPIIILCCLHQTM